MVCASLRARVQISSTPIEVRCVFVFMCGTQHEGQEEERWIPAAHWTASLKELNFRFSERQPHSPALSTPQKVKKN